MVIFSAATLENFIKEASNGLLDSDGFIFLNEGFDLLKQNRHYTFDLLNKGSLKTISLRKKQSIFKFNATSSSNSFFTTLPNSIIKKVSHFKSTKKVSFEFEEEALDDEDGNGADCGWGGWGGWGGGDNIDGVGDGFDINSFFDIWLL